MTLNPLRWPFRAQCLLGFAVCYGLIGFALFSQSYWDLKPCPLCIFQRIAFAAFGAVLLIAGLHAPKAAFGRRAYGLLALIPAAIGGGIAARHVWLTVIPESERPSCGPPLEFMMEINPLTEVIKLVLTGSGECGKIDWTFLGLSMPAWSLLWFVSIAVFILYAAFKARVDRDSAATIAAHTPQGARG
jgi:protein dithiol:quinone oxidoreductase